MYWTHFQPHPTKEPLPLVIVSGIYAWNESQTNSLVWHSWTQTHTDWHVKKKHRDMLVDKIQEPVQVMNQWEPWGPQKKKKVIQRQRDTETSINTCSHPLLSQVRRRKTNAHTHTNCVKCPVNSPLNKLFKFEPKFSLTFDCRGRWLPGLYFLISPEQFPSAGIIWIETRKVNE